MSDEWMLQVSFKVGDTMVNVRGIHAEDLADRWRDMGSLMTEVMNDIKEAQEHFAPAPAARPAFNAEAQLHSQLGATTVAKSCQHGAKELINGKFGPFWGCPARRDDPSRCKPEKHYG